MKFKATLCVIFSLLTIVLAQKDPICRDEPEAKGKCEQVLSGFTFTKEKNGCTPYSASGCRVEGNYFDTRRQCEERCREDFSWNNFLIQSYRGLFTLQNNLAKFLRQLGGNE